MIGGRGAYVCISMSSEPNLTGHWRGYLEKGGGDKCSGSKEDLERGGREHLVQSREERG